MWLEGGREELILFIILYKFLSGVGVGGRIMHGFTESFVGFLYF